MGLINEIQWHISGDKSPDVEKYCSKCGEKRPFINSHKFRVNANGKNIDVWLIYHCSKCQSTWNMTVYERVHPNDLDKALYDGFLSNDFQVATRTGFDTNRLRGSKVHVLEETAVYQIRKNRPVDAFKENRIRISCEDNMAIRIDQLLSSALQVSRSKLKTFEAKGQIGMTPNTLKLKNKVIDGMQIVLTCDTIKAIESVGGTL